MLRTHPLAGTYARLDRADEHIVYLEDQILDFRNRHPTVGGTNLDVHTWEVTETVEQKEPPPLRLAVICGEILFLLRSSLDHLVAQILIPITPPASCDSVLAKSAFPICDSAACLQSLKWHVYVPGVSPEIKAMLTACQPCERKDGLAPEDHFLSVLSRLNNTDKHSLLIILSTRLHMEGIQISGTALFKSLKIAQAGFVTHSTGEMRAELARGTIKEGGTVEMNAHYAVEIAFKKVGTREAEPVIPTLRNLAHSTRELIDSFRVALFP
jgi:hypothetical protein